MHFKIICIRHSFFYKNIHHLSKAQLIAIFAAVALVVLLLFAPQKPPLSEKVADVSGDAGEKINLAISYLQEGKDPMKGIMLFREILEKDSNNIKAHYYLGIFSLQSGQWEKARNRFLKVLELDKNETEAYFYLGQANANLKDTANAIEAFEKYKTFTQTGNRQDEVQLLINELKK